MEDLVITEHRWAGIGPAPVVGERPGRVKDPAGKHEHSRRDPGMDPHLRQGKASDPAIRRRSGMCFSNLSTRDRWFVPKRALVSAVFWTVDWETDWNTSSMILIVT